MIFREHNWHRKVLKMWILVTCLWVSISWNLHAQQAQTQVDIALSHETIAVGESFTAAITLEMPSHWHTYWKNPGQAGMPTSLQWNMDAAFVPGDIQWPIPHRFGEADATTYGYEKSITLLVPIVLQSDLSNGSYPIDVQVSWLECEELCVPGSKEVSTTIQVASSSKMNADLESDFDQWQDMIPPVKPILSGSIEWGPAADGNKDKKNFRAQLALNENWLNAEPDFFPFTIQDVDITVDHKNRTRAKTHLVFSGEIFKYDGDWPKNMAGLVVFTDSSTRDQSARQILLTEGSVSLTAQDGEKIEKDSNQNLPLGSVFNNISTGSDLNSAFPSRNTDNEIVSVDPPSVVAFPDTPTPDAQVDSPQVEAQPEMATQVDSVIDQNADTTVNAIDSEDKKYTLNEIATFMLFAFGGGVLLNFMPCVLPVVFLKVMSFVKMRSESPGQIKAHGFWYLIGILCCYLILALIIIGLRSSGQQLGFGFQFTNPFFVIAMAVFTALIALNLFGVFEIIIGGNATQTAGKLSGKTGNIGAFWSGCFTTLLGTPCMAPGLAAAAGFALSANTPEWLMILTFLTMGLGLAAPYVLASLFPAFIRLLPKPGAWMEHFKIAMGFPMAGASVWLLTLNEIHYGTKGILWVGLFIVCIALAFWVFGTFIQRSVGKPAFAWVVIIFILSGGYLFALENQLNWRNPSKPDMEPVFASQESYTADGKLVWRPWSPAAIQAAQQSGRPVFVDFTATWCINCKENKKRAIDVPETRELLKQMNVLLLKGDYSLQPPEMTEELAKFGRAGVPLNLVYSPNPETKPIVLPTFLTKKDVLDNLESIQTP